MARGGGSEAGCHPPAARSGQATRPSRLRLPSCGSACSGGPRPCGCAWAERRGSSIWSGFRGTVGGRGRRAAILMLPGRKSRSRGSFTPQTNYPGRCRGTRKQALETTRCFSLRSGKSTSRNLRPLGKTEENIPAFLSALLFASSHGTRKVCPARLGSSSPTLSVCPSVSLPAAHTFSPAHEPRSCPGTRPPCWPDSARGWVLASGLQRDGGPPCSLPGCSRQTVPAPSCSLVTICQLVQNLQGRGFCS